MPWLQRNAVPPRITPAATYRKALAEAEDRLRKAGTEPTIEALANELDVSPRTVARWREKSAS